MKILRVLLALGLALGGMLLVTPAASAHVGRVVADCFQLDINLTKYQATKNKVNEVKVWVDGDKVVDEKFKTDYSTTVTFDSSWEAHTYKVRVHAQDDPNSKKGWSFTKEGSTIPCVPEKPSKEDVVEVVEGTPNCDTREVLITTTITKFDFKFDEKTGEWVETSSQETVVTTREATTEECPVVTTSPTTEPPVTTPPVTTPPTTTPPVTTPPVTTPPETTPSVTTPPTTNPPVSTPTSSVPTDRVQRAANDGELAYTGVNPWIVGGIALAVIIAGAGLLRFRRV